MPCAARGDMHEERNGVRVAAYLTKPLDFDTLFSLIAQYVAPKNSAQVVV
jgi:hypothetical protein